MHSLHIADPWFWTPGDQEGKPTALVVLLYHSPPFA